MSLLKLLLIFIVGVVVYYIGLFILAQAQPETAKYFDWIFGDPKIQKHILAIIVEVLPLCLAGFFGGLGGLLRVYTGRLELLAAQPEWVDDPHTEAESERNIPKSGTRQVSHKEDAMLRLGVLMGIIGYLVVNSKFLIKLFYPTLQVDNAELTFTGIALAGVIFGYLASEILGISKNILIGKLRGATEASDGKDK